MNNRNFDNEIQTSGDMVAKIAQNNALLLKTPSTFTATQTYDQINVNKITYVTPANNTINLGGVLTGTSSTCIGVGSSCGNNSVCLGTNSGNGSSINNTYLGSNITHLGNAVYNNSVAIGNSSIINANNSIFIGTPLQITKIPRPVISNPVTIDYPTFPTLSSSQVGYTLSTTRTANFINSTGTYQNMNNIVVPIGVWQINYSMAFIPVTLATGFEYFNCAITIADTIINTIEYQATSSVIRLDYTTLNKYNSTCLNYTITVTNNTLIDKPYFANIFFFATGVDPSKIQYTIKMECIRLT